MKRLLPLLVLISACSTSPTPALYTLAPVSGAVVATPAMGIELHRVGLAGYLDRPELVTGTRDYRLILNDTSHWAEPLSNMLDRVLTEDLVQRLPQASVFSETGAISTKPDLVLEIDIQRLDTDANGNLVLLAQVAMRPQGGVAKATNLRIIRPNGAGSSAQQAGAMSAALGELADRIANRVSTP